MYKCPICHQALEPISRALSCSSGHHFDQHASGYYHLMAKSRKQRMGDDDEMILARHQFLKLHHYQFLRDALIDMIASLQVSNLVDLGCGDGYYTNAFQSALATCDVYGFDLSKVALKLASKNTRAHYAISSINRLPLFDHQTDLVTALFVPQVFSEIQRILKHDGHLILVSVGPRHLYELKELLYPEVTLNPAPLINPGFDVVKQIRISRKAELKGEACLNLFKMTPYFHRTKASSLALFHENLHLTMSFEFEILLLRVKSF